MATQTNEDSMGTTGNVTVAPTGSQATSTHVPKEPNKHQAGKAVPEQK